MSLNKKEAKDNKEFKVKLGGDDIEKGNLPTYGDDDRDETLLILVKAFNITVEDGDYFKEEDIEEEELRSGFTASKKRKKLKAIKETFRKFRVCLKGDPRDKWMALTDNLPVITQENYEVDTYLGYKLSSITKQTWCINHLTKTLLKSQKIIFNR